MEYNLKIQCPFCSSVLLVRNHSGIETKSIDCPVCKQKSPFGDFKRIVERPEEKTQYPMNAADSGEKDTAINYRLNHTLGTITVLPAGPSFQLKNGKNIIGRRATKSEADIQIPTEPTQKRLSREHLVVEIKWIPAEGFVHYASLYKQRVNRTFINDVQIEYGDCIVLKHGDIIKLPDVIAKFEILDEDNTSLDIKDDDPKRKHE